MTFYNFRLKVIHRDILVGGEELTLTTQSFDGDAPAYTAFQGLQQKGYELIILLDEHDGFRWLGEELPPVSASYQITLEELRFIYGCEFTTKQIAKLHQRTELSPALSVSP